MWHLRKRSRPANVARVCLQRTRSGRAKRRAIGGGQSGRAQSQDQSRPSCQQGAHTPMRSTRQSVSVRKSKSSSGVPFLAQISRSCDSYMVDKRGNNKTMSRQQNRNLAFLDWADEPRNGLVSKLNTTTTTTANSASPRASELFVASWPKRVKLRASLCSCRHDAMQAWHQAPRPPGVARRDRFVAVGVAYTLPTSRKRPAQGGL